MSVKKKSVVRSFRIPEDVCRELEEEASLQGTTLNSLVNYVLTKYVKYDRLMTRLQYMTFPKKILRTLFEATDEEFLGQVAYTFGHDTLRDELDVWPSPLGFEDLLNFIAMRTKHASIGNVYIYKKKEDEYSVVLVHGLGLNFSKAWGRFFKGFLDSFFNDLEPTYDFSEDQLSINIKVN